MVTICDTCPLSLNIPQIPGKLVLLKSILKPAAVLWYRLLACIEKAVGEQHLQGVHLHIITNYKSIYLSRKWTAVGSPKPHLKDLFMFVRITPVKWWLNHLLPYCIVTERRLKRFLSGERVLLHSREIKALYIAEKAILPSLLQQVATVWGLSVNDFQI